MIGATPAPAVVTAVTGTAGPASVTLSWAAPEAGVTGCGVQAYVSGLKSGTLKETTANPITNPRPEPRHGHFFTVKAKNGSGYGLESLPYGPAPADEADRPDHDRHGDVESGDFHVTGTASTVGAFVEVRNATPTGPGTTVLARAQVEPPVAPETVGSYDARARNALAPALSPGTVYVASENGGVAGPFTVTNGEPVRGTPHTPHAVGEGPSRRRRALRRWGRVGVPDPVRPPASRQIPPGDAKSRFLERVRATKSVRGRSGRP